MTARKFKSIDLRVAKMSETDRRTLWDALRPYFADGDADEDPAPDNPPARDDKLSMRQRGRHDPKYVPAGWTVEDGKLRKFQPDEPLIDLDENDRAMLAGLAEDLSDGRMTAAQLICAHNAYASVHGHRYGASWTWFLQQAMELHVHGLVAKRLNAVDAGALSFPDGESILAFCKARKVINPAWLTAAVIDSLLLSVNIGGKGGRGRAGRTPERAVAWLVATYAKSRTRKLAR